MYQLDPTVSLIADWFVGIVTLLIAPVLWFECLNAFKQLQTVPVKFNESEESC
jgi:hypothetical protein